MAFTASNFHSLVELVYKHPEWRAELRRLVLTEEILTLPQVVKELAEAQRELAAAQARTEQRVQDLVVVQQHTVKRIEELAEAQKSFTTELRQLSNLVGSTEEEEAGGVMQVVLEGRGYQAVSEGFNLRMNGEVDVVLPLRDAEGNRL
ncbi:MAG: hypothetical protein FJ010_04045 [Chloroflexi bacterium]|nr:hypothetical protein [Chloroflexota bacterium]